MCEDAFNFPSAINLWPNEMIKYAVIKACRSHNSVVTHEGATFTFKSVHGGMFLSAKGLGCRAGPVQEQKQHVEVCLTPVCRLSRNPA